MDHVAKLVTYRLWLRTTRIVASMFLLTLSHLLSSLTVPVVSKPWMEVPFFSNPLLAPFIATSLTALWRLLSYLDQFDVL